MIKEKRILIFYITEHSGHHSAALAIEKALKLRDPDCQVLCVNVFRHAFPIVERLVHYLYLLVIKKVPVIWEKMYDNPTFYKNTQKVKGFINHLGVKKIKRFIDSFNPDLVVCTQAFPCGIVAEYKKTYGKQIPLIGALTDFSPHLFWIYDLVDYFVVPSQDSMQMLLKKGVDARKVLLLGIPIDPKFSITYDRGELAAQFGLKVDLPIVLVMGGGRGLGPIKNLLVLLDKADLNLQVIMVCGVNDELYNWVQKQSFTKKVLNFAFTDQVERLMSVASLVITKPGGITTAEILAKKRSMIIINPIPGQEARNADFLVKNKIAVKVDSLQEVIPAIKGILKKGSGDDDFLMGCQRLAKPDSSVKLADFLLEYSIKPRY